MELVDIYEIIIKQSKILGKIEVDKINFILLLMDFRLGNIALELDLLLFLRKRKQLYQTGKIIICITILIFFFF